MTNTQTNESSVPAESDDGIEALWRDNPLSNIFISYAREDLDRVRPLTEALKAQGWSVFWDRTIPPGKTWHEVIDAALHKARCVIVAWSEASIQSSWVREEAEEGRERKILVPVLFAEVKPPIGFRSIQAASLVNWDGRPTAEEFQQLVSAVADILGPPKQPAAPRPPPQEPEPTPTQQPESPAPRESPREKGRKGQRPTLWIAGLTLGVVIAGLVAVQMKRPGGVFRDTLRDGSSGPEMVSIPPREFRTGDIQGSGNAGEQPVHLVRIPRPFAMGRYEVTFDEYDVFARATGREQPADQGWGRGRRPVINVSWKDAVAYAEWLSRQTGKRYRLPTEAEWEYAARAGTETAYWWGDEVRKNRANCTDCGSEWDHKQTAPVGSFAPNPWGLYDTAGNVWEWVQNCWHKNYEGAPEDCSYRMLRGGSWFDGPGFVRSADRDGNEPDFWNETLGFRLAQDLD
jgi:formylglycine-generating enzyme required for sulfatase activity